MHRNLCINEDLGSIQKVKNKINKNKIKCDNNYKNIFEFNNDQDLNESDQEDFLKRTTDLNIPELFHPYHYYVNELLMNNWKKLKNWKKLS